MRARPRTGLSDWLSAPARMPDLRTLAQSWRDQDCAVQLDPVAPADPALGAHLRRSFLGALGPGASPQARASLPCPWDPPCALDLFLREQLRAGGDGLPKPYVLFWRQSGARLSVTLRVFGTACDWFPAAAEALVAAMSDRLPWPRAVPGQTGAPAIRGRRFHTPDLAEVPAGPTTLRLLSPMDDEGARPDDTRGPAARLLSRAVRRVDSLARWSGVALAEDAMRDLTAQAHAVHATAVRLTRASRISPNRKGEMRSTAVVTGAIDLPALPPDLRLLLSLACRAHLGRHTNEGLGVITVEPRS